MSAEDFEVLRQHMLAEISAVTFQMRDLIGKAALDERVIMAMGKVPRHEFVPIELRLYAYANVPLPIGFDKTISQPFIVALMTDLLDISADDTVLEIGTGLGYQTAILAQLARKVYSIEIIEELRRQAKQRLNRQGCTNIELKIANGYHGWSEHAPFDKVIVTAAPDLIPPPLIYQLKAGGKMVVPAGLPDAQQLVLVEKHNNGRVTIREILQVRFSQPRGHRTELTPHATTADRLSGPRPVNVARKNTGMMLEFTVGINIPGKRESVTVAAEDALIAALKLKYERPDAVIN
jgi:protein-L-isoaspartate(D-aspartate) O-methyltransferase